MEKVIKYKNEKYRSLEELCRKQGFTASAYSSFCKREGRNTSDLRKNIEDYKKYIKKAASKYVYKGKEYPSISRMCYDIDIDYDSYRSWCRTYGYDAKQVENIDKYMSNHYNR